jgi:cobalt transporter subunit CbtA
MLNRLLLTGVISGLLVGVLVTLIHLATVTPIILQAETFEEKVAAAAPAHGHADAQAPHEHEAWAPEDGLERSLYTLAANLVMTVGFGLLLAAGFTVAGTPLSLGLGALWGLGGYLSFSFLPGLGLPPELPGAAAADLVARQTWWMATVAASVAGLALVAFARTWALRILGVVFLVAPHLVGAPHPAADAAGLVPPELAAHFVMATMFMNAAMWVALGVAAAWLYERFGRAQRGTVVDITA